MVSTNAYDRAAFVAEYYDYLPPIAGRTDREFYSECARAAGDPVLELGCGTGRILLPLAMEGRRVTGLDLSEHMLARCRAKLEAQPAEVRQRVRLVRGDMTDFHLDEAFRLIIIPFRPFQHLLEVEQQQACLRCAHRHLAEGGKLVLDFFHTDPRRTHDPVFLQESSPHPEVALPDGRRILLRERTVAFHRAEQCNDVELIYYVTHPDGRTERLVFAFTVRYFFRYEVEHLLARCGFRVAALFGSLDRAPLTDASPEMIFVAEKAAWSQAPGSSRL
jgi:SAM-dependent methyltransferase